MAKVTLTPADRIHSVTLSPLELQALVRHTVLQAIPLARGVSGLDCNHPVTHQLADACLSGYQSTLLDILGQSGITGLLGPTPGDGYSLCVESAEVTVSPAGHR